MKFSHYDHKKSLRVSLQRFCMLDPEHLNIATTSAHP